jgi:hypothetical protein
MSTSDTLSRDVEFLQGIAVVTLLALAAIYGLWRRRHASDAAPERKAHRADEPDGVSAVNPSERVEALTR